jgi:hypothetical protein
MRCSTKDGPTPAPQLDTSALQAHPRRPHASADATRAALAMYHARAAFDRRCAQLQLQLHRPRASAHQ